MIIGCMLLSDLRTNQNVKYQTKLYSKLLKPMLVCLYKTFGQSSVCSCAVFI